MQNTLGTQEADRSVKESDTLDSSNSEVLTFSTSTPLSPPVALKEQLAQRWAPNNRTDILSFTDNPLASAEHNIFLIDNVQTGCDWYDPTYTFPLDAAVSSDQLLRTRAFDFPAAV